MEHEYISISEMARIHGISRQTLILYDKLDVFKPLHVSESGYRYYSAYQIPYLREICFLRKMGFSLEQISLYMNKHTIHEKYDMIKTLEKEVELELEKLQERFECIERRLQEFADVTTRQKNINYPYIQYYPEMTVVFKEFKEEMVGRKQLHLTLMEVWREVVESGMIPSHEFGVLINYNSVKEGKGMKGAGSLIPVSHPEIIHNKKDLRVIPAGEYATIYKYGMPYDMDAALHLIDWVHEQGYEIIGDIIDVCFLDTTFYDEKHKEDFCQLRIPIRERK